MHWSLAVASTIRSASIWIMPVKTAALKLGADLKDSLECAKLVMRVL